MRCLFQSFRPLLILFVFGQILKAVFFVAGAPSGCLLFHLALRGDLRLGSVRHLLHLHQLLLQQLVHGWSRPPRADAIDEAAASEVGEDGSGLEVLKAASPTTLGGRDARSLVSIVSSATAKNK